MGDGMVNADLATYGSCLQCALSVSGAAVRGPPASAHKIARSVRAACLLPSLLPHVTSPRVPTVPGLPIDRYAGRQRHATKAEISARDSPFFRSKSWD